MPQNISVVVIDSNTDSINNIVKSIKSLGNDVSLEGTATNFESGYELIHRRRPMVVIMEVAEDVALSIQYICQILSKFPQISIFATSADKTSETILKVMRAGATEYLLRPVSETDLTFALQKLGRLWLVKTSPGEQVGNVISVFSPKGGVGVTTLSINLAAAIHEATTKPTILIDLDLNAGDVTTFLNMKTSYTISDVTTNISRLDKSFLQGVIQKHSSGISVLAEPKKVEEGISISVGEIKKVLALLKTMYDYIIIDTETLLDRTMAAIETSDMILLVFVMSLPSITNIQRYLKYFEKQGFGGDKIKLVANRYLKKGDIKTEDAAKALNHKIYWSIPNEYDIAISCLNKGVPLTTGAPKSALSQNIKELAKTITEDITKTEDIKGGRY
jgi:pilus assembly protein CpaE